MSPLSLFWIKHSSKIIRQMKKNAVYLLLDRNRFACNTLNFLPANQNEHLTTLKLLRLIKIHVISQPCLHTLIFTHLLTNERARTVLIIL